MNNNDYPVSDTFLAVLAAFTAITALSAIIESCDPDVVASEPKAGRVRTELSIPMRQEVVSGITISREPVLTITGTPGYQVVKDRSGTEIVYQ